MWCDPVFSSLIASFCYLTSRKKGARLVLMCCYEDWRRRTLRASVDEMVRSADSMVQWLSSLLFYLFFDFFDFQCKGRFFFILFLIIFELPCLKMIRRVNPTSSNPKAAMWDVLRSRWTSFWKRLCTFLNWGLEWCSGTCCFWVFGLRRVRCRHLGLAGKLVHELPRFHGNASDHLLKETETGLEPLRPCSRAFDLIEALAETWHRPVLWERAWTCLFLLSLYMNWVTMKLTDRLFCLLFVRLENHSPPLLHVFHSLTQQLS